MKASGSGKSWQDRITLELLRILEVIDPSDALPFEIPSLARV